MNLSPKNIRLMIRRPKRQRIAASLFAGLALLVAAAQYWNSTPDSEQTTRLLYSSVVYGDIEHAVTAAGTLQPSRFVDVGAQVSGQLEELYVDVGDNVIVGELLAEIDATVRK